ncbi:MAG TPA: YgeY family selenium metabolism-linked hydrolase, partial [Clostridiales bacterium]|nr:YgeY family selenium metabolism-linked hydrolase [Clostridiales bacterium]
MDSKYEKLIALCQSLIRAGTLSGEEGPVANLLIQFFRENDFDDIRTDAYGNVIACIKGNRPGKKLLFDAHMDTVPVSDPSVWTVDPWGGEIKDGRLYGRGATDMKGSLAAMMCAAAAFAGDTQKDFPGEIYIAGVVHEECFEGIASREISKSVKPDYVVIGEASDLNLKIGQRGRAEIVVETFGKPAHSANPEKGLNAVYKMADVIKAIKTLIPTEHPVLGKGILELTDIKSSPYPGASVVP